MSLVGSKCRGCGREALLAVIMDPFSDSCYGLCRECMTPIFERLGLVSLRGGVGYSALTSAAHP